MIYGEPRPDPARADPGQGRPVCPGGRLPRGPLAEARSAARTGSRPSGPGSSAGRSATPAPLLERDFARLAGLGWIGKNTCLIDRKAGSFTVLGSLLVDLELAYDAPFEADHCGTCTRCLDACPTDAFDGPYQLDARRCISYWTIEHKGPIPDEAAERLGGWAFGCDVCQDVCPWNRKAPPGREPALDAEARVDQPRPDRLARRATRPRSRRAIKGTALARSKRSGLLRNAALILGTRRVAEAVPALIGGSATPTRSSGAPRPGPWAGSARPRPSEALRAGGRRPRPGGSRGDPPGPGASLAAAGQALAACR